MNSRRCDAGSKHWTPQVLSASTGAAFHGMTSSPSFEHAVNDILFAPQSSDAPIQIAGPAESAGLTADAIWFLGADEESWPAVASLHPFLPAYVQREAAMPHSSHQLDWQFASAITSRLLASAPEVHFSFAAQKDEAETRPSRLITQLASHGRALAVSSGSSTP